MLEVLLIKKIVILESYTVNPGDLSWDSFAEFGEVKIYDRTLEGEVVERIGDAEYIFVNKFHVTEEILDKCPDLKYIGVLATGYNNVDVKACKERNIVVCNIPSYGTSAVAQHVFALILEISNHVYEHSKSVFDGVWSKKPDFCYWEHPIIELSGKTMGIIGFGNIGQAVSKIAIAFGMDVVYYSRSPHKELESDKCKYLSLDELYEKSDIITLHCILTPDTKHMVNKDSIKKMKKSVILVNTSRGDLVVEEDLKDALNEDRIFYAASDVVSVEPIKTSNQLLGAKNMIITPHIAWASMEARERLIEIAAQNLKAFIMGNPINVVN
jgi:glycerate dehydrogenase